MVIGKGQIRSSDCDNHGRIIRWSEDEAVDEEVVVGGRKIYFVKRHSMRLAVCARWYATPLEFNRKAETVAYRVLKRAVIQNSRRWKIDRVVMKNGARQSGFSRWRRYTATIVPTPEALPRTKARSEIPVRALCPPGSISESVEKIGYDDEYDFGGCCSCGCSVVCPLPSGYCCLLVISG